VLMYVVRCRVPIEWKTYKVASFLDQTVIVEWLCQAGDILFSVAVLSKSRFIVTLGKILVSGENLRL